jgi:hypothetical protein
VEEQSAPTRRLSGRARTTNARRPRSRFTMLYSWSLKCSRRRARSYPLHSVPQLLLQHRDEAVRRPHRRRVERDGTRSLPRGPEGPRSLRLRETGVGDVGQRTFMRIQVSVREISHRVLSFSCSFSFLLHHIRSAVVLYRRALSIGSFCNVRSVRIL